MVSTKRLFRWMTAVATVAALTFAVGALSDTSSARVNGGISLRIIAHQEECQATLLSASSTTSALYAEAKLHNSGQNGIQAVTFAVVFHYRDGKEGKPVMIKGQRVAVRLEPGASVELAPAIDAMALSRELRAGRIGAVAELGILEVEFRNGSVWRSPASKLGHFGTKPALNANSRSCGSPFFAVAHALGLDDEYGHFKCADDANVWLFCQNGNSKCTTSECPTAECANQVCKYQAAE